jgi:hypothetical protein
MADETPKEPTDQPADEPVEQPEAESAQGDAREDAAAEDDSVGESPVAAPDPPAEEPEVSRHDEDHNYYYASAEITERSGIFPKWMMVLIAFFVVFGVLYIYYNWDGGDPYEPARDPYRVKPPDKQTAPTDPADESGE